MHRMVVFLVLLAVKSMEALQVNYESRGTVDTNVGNGKGSGNGMNIYRVGNGSACIVWNYDVYGADTSKTRTRELADLLAQKGYLVIVPDYFRGESVDPKANGGAGAFLKEQSNWTRLKSDWEEIVLPYAKEHGAKTTCGAMGTCWGSYMVMRLSSYPEIEAGVSMHPAHSSIMERLGEDEEAILQEVRPRSHQLLMPSKSDHRNVKPGGLTERVLGASRVKIVPFADMDHGWTTRGEISDTEIYMNIVKAMNLALRHFDKHLKKQRTTKEFKLADLVV